MRFLSCDSGHPAALFGTAVTSLGTLAAVLHLLVPCTFITTSLADVGTDAAQLLSGLPAYAHHLGSGITDSRTLHIQLDAAGHHLYVFFLQARGSTVVTDSRAIEASVNTAFVLVVISCHNNRF